MGDFWCRYWSTDVWLLIMTTKDKLIFISSFIYFLHWGVRLFNVTLNSLL
jgi:hypothetical protein